MAIAPPRQIPLTKGQVGEMIGQRVAKGKTRQEAIDQLKQDAIKGANYCDGQAQMAQDTLNHLQGVINDLQGKLTRAIDQATLERQKIEILNEISAEEGRPPHIG
jgi:hypothetical protein